MSELKVGPLARSILLAMVFFVLGRIIVDQMGSTGVWLIFGLLAVFYGALWLFRRSRRKGG
jgi:positive regulator of sigma E activity